MKKFLVILLTLVMMFSLSISAFAAETVTSVTSTSDGSVTVTVDEGTDGGTIYCVTVDWTDDALKYQKANNGIWDPATHTYTGVTINEWTDDTAAVKVTNHSNADVTATIATKEIVTNTSYSFDKESFDLATAENTDVNDAPNNTFTITASGTPTAGTDTFTVTISAATAAEPETIDLTVKDGSNLTGKNSSVTVLLPEGYTYDGVTCEIITSSGAHCGCTAAAGSAANEITVTHTGICAGGSTITLVVTSTADPSVTGSIDIYCGG